MNERTFENFLVSCGCEVYQYEGQEGEFLRKKFKLEELCSYLGFDVGQVKDTMSDEDFLNVKDGCVVEFVCSTECIQYYVNQYHWGCTEIESDLGRALLSLLIKRQSLNPSGIQNATASSQMLYKDRTR